MQTQTVDLQKETPVEVLVNPTSDRKIVYLKDDSQSAKLKSGTCVSRPTCPGHCACASK